MVEEALAGIDEQAALLPESAAANFQRWPNVLGQPSVFTASGRVVAPTWQGEVQYVRDWVERRTRHLEEAYGLGMPILQYAAHTASIGWQRPLTQGQIVGGPVNAGRQLEDPAESRHHAEIPQARPTNSRGRLWHKARKRIGRAAVNNTTRS